MPLPILSTTTPPSPILAPRLDPQHSNLDSIPSMVTGNTRCKNCQPDYWVWYCVDCDVAMDTSHECSHAVYTERKYLICSYCASYPCTCVISICVPFIMSVVHR